MLVIIENSYHNDTVYVHLEEKNATHQVADT